MNVVFNNTGGGACVNRGNPPLRAAATRLPSTLAAFTTATALAAGCSAPTPQCPAPDLACRATQKPWSVPLPVPSVYAPATNPSYPGADYYEIHVTQFQQWFGLHAPGTSQRLYTTVWGYGQVGHTYDTGLRDAQGEPMPQSGMYVAPTFFAQRGRPIVVKWVNDLRSADGSPLTSHLFESAYDTTIDGAANNEPHVRVVTHLHGGEDAPASDGEPEAWFTAGNSVVDTYPNQQEPATLWYHDHAMGITRLNVMAIGAGLYVLRDPAQEAALNLPSGPYEIPLAIADRMFAPDGSLSYLSSEITPATSYHPQWAPEFFGDVVTVNSMAWPYLDVEPRKYRFRILNASNARMYNLRLVDVATQQVWSKVWQIGSDGGYLPAPVRLDMTPVRPDDVHDASTKLFLAPAERADILVDFSGLSPGDTLVLVNDAPAPFPDGTPPGPTAEVLHFRVAPLTGADTSSLPPQLNPSPTRLDASQASVVRHFALTEVEDPASGSPIVGLLNNTCFGEPVSENPRLGATEIWEIANTTPDTHPIHLHLVEFNVLDRQLFDADRYLADWNAASDGGGGLPGPIPTCPSTVEPVSPPGVSASSQHVPRAGSHLVGDPIPPAANEAGWKDTVRVKKGTVTRLLVRFAPQDSSEKGPFGGYSFDPTNGTYVWHCHILEHEDNNMMRPYRLMP